METDQQLNAQLCAVADHLLARRNAILEKWRCAVADDPALTSASRLARAEFYDHIPDILDGLDQALRSRYSSEKRDAAEEQKGYAAAHGLHRWHFGYNQRDVMREWSHLHLCLVGELENYSDTHRGAAIDRCMSVARRALAELCSHGVNESATRFAELQQIEAASRIEELQQAIATLTELERLQMETWRRAVHDVRGKFGVIKSITDQLSDEQADQTLKTEFLNLLGKGVTSLHDLLNNLLVLSRLEAGQEQLDVQEMDAAMVLRDMCDSFRPLAAERGLFLRTQGPDSLLVQGDTVSVQRIAQNLISNAIKYTSTGGVTVGWEPFEKEGLKRWALFVQDTGPGLHTGPAGPLTKAVEASTDEAAAIDDIAIAERPPSSTEPVSGGLSSPPEHSGEGIGLAIVKRLCELLDATLELESAPGCGSTFRIVLPRAYDAL
jgi:signal transduction histidine kinase